MQDRLSALQLDAVFKAAKSVSGISQFHYIEPSGDGFITKKYSSEHSVSTSTSEDCTMETKTDGEKYVPETGHVVAVKLAGKRPSVVYLYMAQVLQVDNDEVNLRYLHRCGNLYQWMSDKEDSWQPVSDVLCEMPPRSNE